MKDFFILIILLTTLTACHLNDEYDIKTLQSSNIDFASMPDEVQNAIIEYYKPIISYSKAGDTLKSYGAKDHLVCVDPNIESCQSFVKNHWLVKAWVDRVELIITDKKILVKESYVDFNAPFVYFDNVLYYRENMNATDFNDSSKDEFYKIDLKEIIKY